MSNGPNTATYLERLLTFFRRAVDVSYDNTESGLDATDVQAAIDEIAGASGGGSVAYQGQRELSGSEPVDTGSFVIALEIPVTITDGLLYGVSWSLGISFSTDVARGVGVRFYLATEEGSWDGALTVTQYWYHEYPSTTNRDSPTGAFALVSTGNNPAIPLVPGNYWLRMILSDETSSGGLELFDFHAPSLNLSGAPSP